MLSRGPEGKAAIAAHLQSTLAASLGEAGRSLPRTGSKFAMDVGAS
jgi:hypothetical protein